MLKAILGGKGRRLPESARPGDTYRKVFRTAEDLLTAAVFSRLAYLDPARSWEILRLATHGALPAASGTIHLTEATFWPSWPFTTTEGVRSVEPDVFMSYEIDGQDRRMHLIVECKRDDGHGRDQWIREWRAHAEAYPEEDAARETVLLAVGRWGRAPNAEARTIRMGGGPSMPEGFRVVALSWGDLVDTLARTSLDGGNGRVVADIVDALALHGHISATTLGSLASPSSDTGSFDRSAGIMASMTLHAPVDRMPVVAEAPDPLLGWPSYVAGLRPVTVAHPGLRRM